jgi:hypothetical protein
MSNSKLNKLRYWVNSNSSKMKGSKRPARVFGLDCSASYIRQRQPVTVCHLGSRTLNISAGEFLAIFQPDSDLSSSWWAQSFLPPRGQLVRGCGADPFRLQSPLRLCICAVHLCPPTTIVFWSSATHVSGSRRNGSLPSCRREPCGINHRCSRVTRYGIGKRPSPRPGEWTGGRFLHPTQWWRRRPLISCIRQRSSRWIRPMFSPALEAEITPFIIDRHDLRA